ncbi:hypothetical protein CsatB_024326 [Cannabis sativa]
MNIFYTSHKTILFHLAYWTRLEDHVFYYTSGFCTFNWCKESLTIFFVLLSQFGCQMWDPLKRNELNGYHIEWLIQIQVNYGYYHTIWMNTGCL